MTTTGPEDRSPAESRDLVWTEDKVVRFWDGMAGRNPERYFSAMHSSAIASWFEKQAHPRRDRLIVDVGCGRGHLLGELAGRGYRVLGVDSSPQSLAATALRIGQDRVALGSVADLPVKSGAATGGLLLIETIEHVLEDDLRPMMREIARVLGPDAPLLITTPNAEDLEAVKVSCPDCGARFHPMQHVRSWNATTMGLFLRESGFSRVMVHETRLPAGRGPMAFARRLLYQARGDKAHLIALAKV